MRNRFKVIFIVRFFGYLVFFTGLLGLIFMLGPMVQAEVGYRIDRITKIKRVVPDNIDIARQLQNPEQNPEATKSGNFADLAANEENIIPVSTEYGIVIEKINANARIIPKVNPGKEREYVAALASGVAEALGSTPPGEPGNLYLFSHSVDAPWNIVRFNAIFYLLKELEPGDRVIIFYNNKRYDYIVFDKIIASPGDVSFLTNRYDYPVLTLQTCDPPGTLLNRLIIRARLINS